MQIGGLNAVMIDDGDFSCGYMKLILAAFIYHAPLSIPTNACAGKIHNNWGSQAASTNNQRTG